MIVCEPTSGLTSRIYVLADAYALAKKTGQELVIIWTKTSDCDCTYAEVFDRTQFADIPCQVIECNRFDAKFSDLKKNLTIKNIGAIFHEIGVRLTFAVKYPMIRRNYLKKTQIHKNSYLDQNALFPEEEAQGKSCYFEAYNCITSKGSLTTIVFHPEYVKEADAIMKARDGFAVGVHIRRTDHQPAIQGSTTDHFIERLSQEIQKREDVFFYLATDDWSEEEKMRKQFGDRIITQPNKVLSRSSKEGMHSSIIDLLCLSKTHYVLGSYSSIFSKFSAEYGQIELEIV